MGRIDCSQFEVGRFNVDSQRVLRDLYLVGCFRAEEAHSEKCHRVRLTWRQRR